MASRVCKVVAVSALFVFICGVTTVNAETVVRKDRIHRNEIVSNTRNMLRVSNEMTRSNMVIPEANEETKEEGSIADNDKMENIDKDSYFADFTLDEAKLQFSVYDLDWGCSYMDYQSIFSYRNPAKNQYLGIYLVKRRLAGALEAKYEYILTCSYSIDVHPKVSKKHPAYLEYTIDNRIVEVPLKIQFYSDNYFAAKDMNKIIHSMPKNVANLKIVVSTREGNQLKVPITDSTIEQWHTVVDADLKELKNEYDS